MQTLLSELGSKQRNRRYQSRRVDQRNTSAFSSSTEIASITVSEVNDAPVNITNLSHFHLVGSTLVSQNGQYRLGVQSSGDLTLTNLSGQVVWNTATSGTSMLHALQNDGNLVLYDGATPRWASNTNGINANRNADSRCNE